MRGSGTVTGRTVSIIQGHPGALMGKPDPNWKPPPPQPMPNSVVYWLRLDLETGQRLFSSISDANGAFSIHLPAGCYLSRSAEQSLKQKQVDVTRLGQEETIALLFPGYEAQGSGAEAIARGECLPVRFGETVEKEIAARVLFVD